MFSNTSGVLFFGAEGEKPVAWNSIPEFLDTIDLGEEEQNKAYATMRSSQAITMSCRINKKGIKNLMEIFRPFKLARGPERKRMIQRAKKMQTNYIFNYTFTKEGDEYVDERGAFRFVLQ